MSFDFFNSLSWTWHAAFWMTTYAVVRAVSEPVWKWAIVGKPFRAVHWRYEASYWIFIALLVLEGFTLLALPFLLVVMAAFGDSFWGPAIVFSIAYMFSFCLALEFSGEGAVIYMYHLFPIIAAPPLAILVRLIRHFLV